MSSTVQVSFKTRSEIQRSSVWRFVQGVRSAYRSGGKIGSWFTMKKFRCRLFAICRAT
jgi:hypothetical protein